MKIQKNIEVWLVKKRPVRPIDLVQYDTGIQLVFTLNDFDAPTNTSATLYVQKRSGKFVYQETGIIVSGNTITVDLNNQALTEHGDMGYQVKLKNGSDTITTFAGIFRVEKSLADSGATESKTVIAAFEAKTAEQIAEIEAAAQEQIAQIQNLYNTYATKNDAANAIKGNLSGAVVVADDVSPVEHNPIVKVHGKNLLKPEISREWQCTATVADDGKITLTNTDTSGVAFAKVGNITLKKGRTYIFSKSGAVNVSQTPIWKTGTTNVAWIPTTAFTPDEDVNVDVAVYMSDISTVGNTATAYIQIEESSVATAYEPYIDPSTVKVRRCGKNIFGVAAKSQTQNGVTFTVNDDGSVTANGTATKATFIGLGSLVLKPDEKYRLSGSPAGSGFDTYMLYIHNNTTGADIYDTGEGKVFTGKEGDLGVTIAVYAGNTVNNLIFRPMVVYGEESGTFEPYNGTEYAPDADGAVSSITSLSPNMTILTDTDGVIAECEYNVDTKKYVDSALRPTDEQVQAAVEAYIAENFPDGDGVKY